MADYEENEQQMDCALDLMRRLPPQSVEENLVTLLEVLPELTEDLLAAVDQPLKVRQDAHSGKEYLVCDYNRDGDSYRSPWTNTYDPPLADGNVPSERLRKLEASANDAFSTYKDLYYEGGVSSVYLWDMDESFAGVVLIKKVNDGTVRSKGSWDSIHVVEVLETGRQARYKLTSTVMLYTVASGARGDRQSEINLSGSLTRQDERELLVEDPNAHVANIGRMVEDMEFKMRNSLQEVYFGKTHDIVNGLRSAADLGETKTRERLQRDLFGQLKSRKD
ncbi:F-actin-capping protein subunit beta [Coemansia sp. RSA 2523]|nr:F-actin-capping protein subunit beta [Coemansia sp. RSA 1591]KAJ1765761.1 F-actin-capping protein subunit beta [Coemansia sp. RSA 1752]KAJ1774355.1 F-actin-capping protein subunit beta [Coemansia sp. RSA 1824]KAJ1785605.1 F-actin-capping protein subunit beta [Coemansia sp. RSA 2167]KAJ1793937.1 F-actin-capping protein subunit beta [Coemansia sp. RSA 1938]KAJ1811499.1 F-actin-capping protein subunit beta [Coemansia sp. RSA 2523]KAJ2155605.1 F-actin-capping protein subunit beta [Coemansia sp